VDARVPFRLTGLADLLESICDRAYSTQGSFRLTKSEREALEAYARVRPGFRKWIERLGVKTAFDPLESKDFKRYNARSNIVRLAVGGEVR
jgi:hypothetical protein